MVRYNPAKPQERRVDLSLGGSEGAASSQLRDAAFVQTLMWISVFS